MKASTERLILITGALVMIIGMPLVIALALLLGKIPFEEVLTTHPLVIIPYAFVKIGWGLIWAIVAVDWVVHGSHGIRRVLIEFIKSERGRKIIDLVLNIVMVITGIIMFYVLVFVS
ncbi:MAG: succinate dehydrogenase [Thermoproteus sp.]|jgi:putative succinate dehydrogenase/fumarate reductase subunit D|nr:succinate dehydrogenase [Thermoproteus sp.]MDT7882450.1 succinate dehydrogenase [Thermoproteus sp.]